MPVIDLSAVPSVERLRGCLGAVRRAWQRALDCGDLEIAQTCNALELEVLAEIVTREASNG
jgi:hypothetical protein